MHNSTRFGGGWHRLLLLPYIHLMGKVRTLMVELGAGLVHPRPSKLRLGCLPQDQVMAGVKLMGVVGLEVGLVR
eukprot:10162264-Ditylum_brightwellii.AAC.1